MKVGRLAEISRIFLEEGLALGGAAEQGQHFPKTDREKGARLRRALERLGPTFIKFGQLLATRLDLFSHEFLNELAELRAHVPPYPTEQAREIIASTLESDVSEIFSDFPEHPIASASMAQVYRARLREEKEWVAVKVVRPGLQEKLERDLQIIIDLSRTLDSLLPVYHRSMVHRVAIEYAARTRQEADLLAEAHAMEKFGELSESVPQFVVPQVHLRYCTSEVLVMQFLEGTLLDQLEDGAALRDQGVDPHEFCRSILRLQLVMSYEFGFVHGDTHPGNLILQGPEKVGLIDFGLHGQVPRRLCDQMLELLFHQASGSTVEAVRAFEQIFTTTTPIDKQKFEAELSEILEAEMVPGAQNPLTGQLAAGLRLGARYQLRAKSELFLILRNLTIVEGIVLTYDPELDVVGEAKQMLQKIIWRRALHGLGESPLGEVGPLALLNLAKRPQLIAGLLRLERSFTDSVDLGEFLKKEGVLETSSKKPTSPWWIPVLIGVLSALSTAFLLRALAF